MLVDDHEMVRIGLSAVLGTEEDIELVGEAGSGEEGIRLAREYKPDVVLMDLGHGRDGRHRDDAALVEGMPECKVIVLTSYIDDAKIYPVIEAGSVQLLAEDVARA